MNKHVANVLIAEDSPTQAAQITGFLSELGYVVSAARTGQEAYDRAVAERPDILVSDIVMPGMDGYELCRRVKATPGMEETPVILVTSLSQPQDVLAGLEAGADNFIIKPYDEEILGSRINYLLQNRRLRRTGRGGDTLEIEVGGERHSITARKQQILDLLISTYAQAVHLFSALDQGRQELSQSYELLHALYDMAEGLNRCRTLADVAMTTVSRSLGIPEIRDAWMYQWDDDGLRLVANRHAGSGNRSDPYPPSGQGGAADGAPVVRTTAGFAHMVGASHHISLRLDAGGRTIGYLNLAGVEPAIASDVALQTLSGIASQISVALERAILHTDLENEVRKRTQRVLEEAEERRHATETIAAIFNASPVAIVSLDAQLNVATWNNSAREILHIAEDEAAGRPWFALFRAPPAALHRAMAVIRSGVEMTGLEIDVAIADGTTLSFHVAGEPLIDAAGLFRGAVLAIDDITDRKQVKEQLHQAQKMEAVGNLTGGIAHDFNNLLTMIIGNLDLAALRPDAEDMRPFVDVAMRASLRGAELTKKLLAFARKQPLDVQPVDVREMLEELRILLEGSLGPNIALSLSVAPEMPEVFADGARLQAALMNLALNARDAMPEGGRLAIDVSLADVEIVPGKRAASVVFTVTDTGVGIPREHLERIFEPFFTTKQEGKGSGLGLAMVYGFATQSAGALSVESEVGVGTTFRLVLPALRDTRRADRQSPADVARPFTARSVLLVEADPEVRRTVQTLLRSIGHEVFGVANADQALQSLRSEAAFDILLADLDLPGGIDGWSLADAAAAVAPRCHVLLMSGSGDAPAGQDGPRPYRVLAKPFRVDDLRDAIMAL